VKNIALILTLLLVPDLALTLAHVPAPWPGRVSLALVFAFTGLGHFIKTTEMVWMLPPWVPVRIPLIYATGVFEWLGALGVLIPQVSHYSGMLLCVFLILVLPSNVYAAVHHVDFGGHSAGPIYLLIRIPLQLVLIGWVFWFTIRS
jgi:uncharacterized membrane protein